MGRGLFTISLGLFLVALLGFFEAAIAAPACRQAFTTANQTKSEANSSVENTNTETKTEMIFPWSRNDVRPKVDSQVARNVTQEIQAVVADSFAVDSRPVLASEYNRIVSWAFEFAEQNGIRVEFVQETMGVFPNGLHFVGISGLGKISDPTALVNFGKRHELAHLLHVLQTRVILLRSLGTRPTAEEVKQIETFLTSFEGGGNYREIERMVTSISGLPHAFSSELSQAGAYRDNVISLLGGIESGLLAGRPEFQSLKGFIGVYALFISKAPLLVGSSLKQLSVRFTFSAFVVTYAIDPAFRAWIAQLLLDDRKHHNKDFDFQ